MSTVAGNPAPALSTPISPVEWRRAVHRIEAAGEVCLACHVSPDGDALGSMLSLAHALRARGQRVYASFGDDPFVVPHILRFLPGLDLLTAPADVPAAPEVMVTFDAASIERLGRLTDTAIKAGELIVVDHHRSNTRFGTIHLVDPGAAATAVITEKLIRRLGVPLTQEMALGLYTGLVTDTGSFKFSSTTPGVHELAARLLATGISPQAVAHELWDRAPFGYLRVLSGALARARLEPAAVDGLGLVWTTVTRAERRAHQVAYDQLESVIDTLRRTDGAEVAVVLKETDDGIWYVSTRSKGRVDVSRVCGSFSGGGTATMAAFLWDGRVEEAMDRLRHRLATAARAGAAEG